MDLNQLPNPNDTQYIDISEISNEMSKESELINSINKVYNLDGKLLKPPYKRIIFSHKWRGRRSLPYKVIYDEQDNMILSIVGGDYAQLIIDKDGNRTANYIEDSDDPDDKFEDDNEKMICCLYIFSPVLFALALLNCKRTTLEDDPDAKVKRMLNAHKREKKIIWKVLKINPLRAKNKSEQDSIETGIKRTFHLCRGHFRTYTFPHLLFGKYEGTYYIEAHTRGNEDFGITHKDYHLVAN
jgi:ribosomal protein S14